VSPLLAVSPPQHSNALLLTPTQETQAAQFGSGREFAVRMAARGVSDLPLAAFRGIRLTFPHRARIGLQVFENTPNKNALSTHIWLASRPH
jgi:hypothetical protein